jgi:hypothetical protein
LLSKSPYDAGKDADFDGGMKSAPMQKHVRLRKSGIPEHLLPPPPQEDQIEEQSPAATLWNRSSVEAVSQLEGSKCPGLGRNGRSLFTTCFLSSSLCSC